MMVFYFWLVALVIGSMFMWSIAALDFHSNFRVSGMITVSPFCLFRRRVCRYNYRGGTHLPSSAAVLFVLLVCARHVCDLHVPGK